MDKIFFDNWESIYRTLIIGILAYAALILTDQLRADFNLLRRCFPARRTKERAGRLYNVVEIHRD